MKKQYRYLETCFGKYCLYIYHDGELIEMKELWGDEFFDLIEQLRDSGYTYGFTQKEVDDAREKYKRVFDNQIKKDIYFYTGKKQNLIRILSNSDDCIIDYDKEQKMYRVSIFEDNHFKDEFWFKEYEE